MNTTEYLSDVNADHLARRVAAQLDQGLRELPHDISERLRAARTAFRSAQVSTLREHLMKLGAWVESSVRRIVLHLPATCLHRNDWQIIARSLGAAPA
jgi:hypothetical protein